jgi:hypothetical protein
VGRVGSAGWDYVALEASCWFSDVVESGVGLETAGKSRCSGDVVIVLG